MGQRQPLEVEAVSTQASLFSQDWYRLSGLKPSLRPGVRISRQTHRGEVWYVLLDPVNGVHQRVNRSGYELVGRLDGRHSCEDIWQTLLQRLGQNAPSQNEMIGTMSQLYEANLLSLSTRGDFDHLKAQGKKQQAQHAFASVNPLSFRVAVWRPGEWLDKMQGLSRALFSTPSMIIWLTLMVMSLLTLGIHWRAFSSEVVALWTHPYSLLLSWLIYPFLKLIHELSHALAVRRYGGDVGEFGIRMLTLLPVPYVDASSSNLFAFKHQRAIVAAAGIAAELALAGIAILLWAALSPGMPKSICLFVVVIGGLSTIAFNANPLLKFDGYYVCTDLLELPNLAQRSQQYWKGLCRRYAFGQTDHHGSNLAKGERPWLLAYGVASFAYRWILGVTLVIVAANFHWTVGMAMLVATLFLLLGKPLYQFASYLVNDPSLAHQRPRAVFVSALTGSFLIFALLLVKLPSTTVAQGIVWAPERTQVRALTAGFVEILHVKDGQKVEPKQLLATLVNEELSLDWNRLQAELSEARTERLGAMSSDALQMRTIEDRIGRIEAELALLQKRIDTLDVHAESAGRVAIARVNDLPGRFLKKGEQFAQILTEEPTVVRVAVVNHEAHRVRDRTEAVELRWPNAQRQAVSARMLGEVPATVNSLPSSALGDKGGGRIQVDPQAADGTKTQEPIFLFDLQTSRDADAYPGMRAWVRFDHGDESMLRMLYREWRRTFLKHFEK
jgi:putative peptide zinc metalloprotease protein